jgi:hypothetical protein
MQSNYDARRRHAPSMCTFAVCPTWTFDWRVSTKFGFNVMPLDITEIRNV